MKLSKTQRIASYKLYHYNSEVKLGVNIWHFTPLYYPYNLHTRGILCDRGPENDVLKHIITK